ncbi:LuxR C-terminal-related transcriptional regulator [Micromonospora sp. NPDC049559]|uniref:helix-turn-helix transcriptional regulator n=1 Tax=Micromonospora sp. NPDC049559 TaxID=3155923 RepID=UPI00343F3E28
MSAPQPSPRLGAVGVGPVHERVYRYLIKQGPGRSARDLADGLGVSPRTLGGALHWLEEQGLISRTLTNPPGYSANPPELALERLVSHQGEELAQIRLFAKELQGEFRAAAAQESVADLIEVIVGREQVIRYYLQLMGSTKTEFAALSVPPYVSGDDAGTALLAERAGAERGVRCRSVYGSEALADPTTLAIVRESIELGEEARSIGGLPMKLALFDGRTGFVPLKVNEPGVGALVVHPSPLLDALIALFESIWVRAVPLHSARDGRPATGLDERARQVLLLLAAGLKDESVARALRTSRRTVQKEVTAIMNALGARTRFQAALLARERGWIGGDPARRDGD